jgi:peroxiredoxin
VTLRLAFVFLFVSIAGVLEAGLRRFFRVEAPVTVVEVLLEFAEPWAIHYPYRRRRRIALPFVLFCFSLSGGAVMSRLLGVFGATFLAVCLGLSASAGEFNLVLKPGDAAPTWENLPGTDGKKHSLADLKDKKLVVLVFTCNSCEVAQEYEDRIVEFAKRHAKEVGFVAINVNAVPADSMAKMKERAEAKGFTFPYLYDETQKIAKDYGADRTPEFYLLSADRKVLYMGSMDDGSDVQKPKLHYLEDAVTAALDGAAPKVSETNPRGCRIRWARARTRPEGGK